MKKSIILVVLIFWVFSSIPPSKVVYTSAQNATIDDIIAYNSSKYDVPARELIHIINCESGGKRSAHHLSPKEDSWGVVQINLKAHPNITKQQATDPNFSVDYLAKNIKRHKSWWTCAT